MPQATPELRDRWSSDEAAISFLKDRGYDAGRGPIIYIPKDHTPTPDEESACDYLFQEWDFGVERAV